MDTATTIEGLRNTALTKAVSRVPGGVIGVNRGGQLVASCVDWLWPFVLGNHQIFFRQTKVESFQSDQEEGAYVVGFHQKQVVGSLFALDCSKKLHHWSFLLGCLLVLAKEVGIQFH